MSDGYSVSLDSTTNYEVTGQFGDFVGGVIGTLFALAGTFFIFLTFQEQSNQNKRIAVETIFFEMIRLHRDNVSELRYKKSDFNDGNYENRQVMRVIFQEFIECYREVKKFSNSKEPLDYIAPDYLIKIQQVIARNNLNATPIELARIDIAYSMTFYGVGTEGEVILRRLFRRKYNRHYYFKLLYFIKLKPKKTNKDRFEKWSKARDLELNKLHELVDELYKNRKHPEKNSELSQLGKDFKMNLSYEKYYGGHQFRLGHYFRHLFQSYKFLESSSSLDDKKRYSYGKMLRAQLSTYEQALLFINSVSSIGMKWEYTPELSSDNKTYSKLITKYNIIKNLPGQHLSGIRYKTYYPDVAYETDEHTM